MKKKLLLIAIITLCINFKGNAQTEFGIKAGPNFSKYSGTLYGAQYKYNLGFYVGGFANFGLSEKFKIQTELLFALQGSIYLIKDLEIRDDPSEAPSVGDFKIKTTESTISIPVLAQYFVADKFYLEAGPQVGLILNRKEKVTESPINDPNFNTIPDADNDVFDVGIAGGFGYKLNEKITLNLRYFFGLIEREANQVKSSVLNVGLEYQF